MCLSVGLVAPRVPSYPVGLWAGAIAFAAGQVLVVRCAASPALLADCPHGLAPQFVTHPLIPFPHTPEEGRLPPVENSAVHLSGQGAVRMGGLLRSVHCVCIFT